MDRIKDSGSFDWGSTPHGFTKEIAKLLKHSNLAIFLTYNHWQTTRKILVHGQNDSASLGYRFIS